MYINRSPNDDIFAVRAFLPALALFGVAHVAVKCVFGNALCLNPALFGNIRVDFDAELFQNFGSQ